MKKIFFLSLSFLFVACSFAQTKVTGDFSLNVTFDEAQVGDTVLLKAYTPKLETIDTVLVTTGGKVLFRRDTLLPVGMYRMDIGEKSFDFFLSPGEPQQISANYKLNEGLISAQYTGSPENQALVSYAQFMQEKMMRRQVLQQRIQSNEGNADTLVQLKPQIDKIISEVRNKWTELEKKYDGKMLGLFISSIREPDPAPFVASPLAANPDSLQRDYYYQFFKSHFFEYYNFSSPYILRMPFYSQALTTYFTRVLKPDVQEMSTQIAWLLKQQEGNKALYRYTARELYDLFKSVPYYPDLEALYVEIGREYIAGRPDMWDDTLYVKKVSRLVELSAMNLVGTKTTDLKLNDLAGNSLSLYDVQAAYTVLYFYNPECGSCAKITPEVHKMYQNYKNKGVQVFAVYIDRDQDVWRKYVVGNQYLDWINVWDADETAGVYNKYDLHAIPMIYLLDKDKVILKKDITEGQLDLWLDQLTE